MLPAVETDWILRLLCLLALLLVLSHAASGATLTVEIAHTVAGEPLRLEQRQKMEGGGEMAVTRLDYLITEFALLTPDGRALRADGQAAFLSAGQGRTSFAVPKVPPGKYAGVAFRIGVPAAQAAADPASWPAGHPLNPAVNGLHWGWQGGYVHLALEGRMDGASFSYHLARAENLMTVRVEEPFAIAGDLTMTLRFEISRVLQGVKPLGDAEELGAGERVARVFNPWERLTLTGHGLKTRSTFFAASTHSAPGDVVAARLRGHVSGAWSFAGLRVGGGGFESGRDAASTGMPPGTTAYAFHVPNGFPAPELPADNPLTVEGVALGERLFHETRLSLLGNQSCVNCHRPAHGFSDPRRVSLGTAGEVGTRNAPALLNLAWHRRFAWDGRRERLRDAAIAPIPDQREMALPLEQAVARLAEDAGYREEFARAFGGTPEGAVTSERIGLALEQFLLTRTGASSKFDRVLRGEAQLSDEEAQGFALFHTEYDPAHGRRGADCFHCHGGFDFSDHAFHDTGLGGSDPGRLNATGREEDRGKFKTPTLRNLAHTAPYFHDGRAGTIEEAVAHYDHEVLRTANLDPNLAKRGKLELSGAEQKALVAFLRTLTEE